MATKKAKIWFTFSELKKEFGHLHSDVGLLKQANGFVALFEKKVEQKPSASLRTGGVPFDQYGLDVAMSDGGWRVMARESEMMREIYEDEGGRAANDFSIDLWLQENAA